VEVEEVAQGWSMPEVGTSREIHQAVLAPGTAQEYYQLPLTPLDPVHLAEAKGTVPLAGKTTAPHSESAGRRPELLPGEQPGHYPGAAEEQVQDDCPDQLQFAEGEDCKEVENPGKTSLKEEEE